VTEMKAGFEKPLWLAEMLLVLGLLGAICLHWARALA